MVNGVTDTLQKGRVAAPVAALAAGAGIPQVLVDIRHEATHNHLPSLPLLRLGAAHAMAWLHANYW
jgi:ribosomal biogenesis protein LAS1